MNFTSKSGRQNETLRIIEQKCQKMYVYSKYLKGENLNHDFFTFEIPIISPSELVTAPRHNT